MHKKLKDFMNQTVDVSSVVAYKAEVEPGANQIYNALSMFNALKQVLTTNNLVLWDQNIRPEKESNIYNAQSLWDKITSIRECECDCEAINRLLRYIDIIQVGDVMNKNFINVRANMQVMGNYFLQI